MPVDRSLSNLEWQALANSGRIRSHIDKLQQELETLKAERETLLAENARLKSELQLHRARPPVVSRKIGHLPPDEAKPAPESEEKEESLDDSAARFKLLELD